MIKMLLGLLPATDGRASVLDLDVATAGPAIRQRVGYMPKHDGLPADVAATELVVRARGTAQLHPFELERAERKLSRYLGPEHSTWEQERFGLSTHGVQGAEHSASIRLQPTSLIARDLSFHTRAVLKDLLHVPARRPSRAPDTGTHGLNRLARHRRAAGTTCLRLGTYRAVSAGARVQVALGNAWSGGLAGASAHVVPGDACSCGPAGASAHVAPGDGRGGRHQEGRPSAQRGFVQRHPVDSDTQPIAAAGGSFLPAVTV